jgi:ribosomal protein S18 acetylase RimI-like enzyme
VQTTEIGALTVRPVSLETDDRERVIAFLARLGVTPGVVPGVNIGEINWLGYRDITPSFADSTGLITDGSGAIRGLIWLEPDDEFAVEVDPGLLRDIDVLEQLMRYAEDQLIAMTPDVDVTRGATLTRTDRELGEALARMGMTTEGVARHHTFRTDLTMGSAAPSLVEGFAFGVIDDDDKVAERAAADVAVWPTSSMDTANYHRVRTAALYRPEMDLIVTAPDGRLAAFCLGWFASEHGVVQFEPIGVLSDYRGQGLGKAIVLEGFRRARALGATVAYINCSATNAAGNALYRSVGCELAAEWVWWSGREAPTS